MLTNADIESDLSAIEEWLRAPTQARQMNAPIISLRLKLIHARQFQMILEKLNDNVRKNG